MPEDDLNSHASSPASALLTLALIALVIAALYFAKAILLPVGLAILLTFVLTPLVKTLERWRLGRVPSVMLVVILAFSVLGGIGWLAMDQITELSDRLPEYKYNLIAKIRSVRGSAGAKLEDATEALRDIGQELAEDGDGNDDPSGDTSSRSESRAERRDGSEDAVPVKVTELPPSPLEQIRTWLGPLVAPLTTAGLVVVLVIFMLIKREDLRNRLIQLCGTSNLYATTEAFDDATERLSKYLRMQFLINSIYGVVVAAGLYLIGVPNALLWGVFGMMLRFLPYVGPWIAALMPITLSLAVSEGWSQPLMTIGLLVALEVLVNNVLEPWLYGSSVGVSSLGVVFAAIFWTWLWGPIGLVLAVPLTVCLVVLSKYVPQLAFLPILLGDHFALQPHERLYNRFLTVNDYEARELAQELLRSRSLIEFYDEVVIPTLHLAERDRHAARLNEHQEVEVMESARELMEELGYQQQTSAGREESNRSRTEQPQLSPVFCIPVRDHADETAALLLRQLLTQHGIAADVGSLSLLASEAVERIEQLSCRLVVLSVLPPLGTRNARYLCKRIRRQHPDVRIVVALFQSSPVYNDEASLRANGADIVVTRLVDAVTEIRRWIKHTAPQDQPAPLP